jgi:DNA-binding LytR/AlgR family response regulator
MANPEEQLAGISDAGNAPETRVNDPVAARAICQGLIKDNEKRSKRNALVQGLIDGNPPYNQGALNQNGQKYRSNFNSQQALAFVETATTGFYDLFSEVQTFATVTCDTGDPTKDREYGGILTDEFQKLQAKDEGFDSDIQMSQNEMVTFGAGPMVWDNKYDWMAKAKSHGDVIVSNNEKSKLCDWTKMLVVEEFTISELYGFIRNESAAAARGWNVSAVKEALINANYNDGFTRDSSEWPKLQEMIRNNDLSFSNPDKTVRVGRLYFREFPKNGKKGRVSEVWIALDYETKTGFLYQEIGKFENWKQVICPFMLNKGTGKYHSVKGIGVRMYNLLTMRERLENQKTDAAFTMTSLHVRSTSQEKITPESLVQMGPFTAWKQGFEPMNFNTSGAIEAADVVGRGMDSLVQSNLSQYRPQVAQPRGNPKTAFEIAANVSSQATVTKSGQTKYYEQLDAFYSERFRRATTPNPLGSESAELAKEFLDKVRARGVPKEVFKTCTVTATRTIGQGSAFLRSQNLGELLGAVGPSVSEAGRERMIDDFIASKAGHKHVEIYNPKDGPSVTDDENMWDARVENNSLRNGMPVDPKMTENDLVHSQVHTEAAAEAIQSVAQGGDPEQVLVFVVGVIEHVAQAHLPKLLADPLRALQGEQIKGLLEQLEDQAQELQRMLEQQAQQAQELQAAEQEAQAIRSGTDPNILIKQADTEQKIRERELKAQQQLTHKQERHDQTMRQTEQRFAQQQRQTLRDVNAPA